MRIRVECVDNIYNKQGYELDGSRKRRYKKP